MSVQLQEELQTLIEPAIAFLQEQTPVAWLTCAGERLDLLLIDHANCEKKAASTALNLLYRYVDRPELLDRLSRLAREELRHFEQVLGFMRRRGINYCHLSPSRYASGLRSEVRNHEPERLIDTLIVGAFIEARSCERFAALIPWLDDDLAVFYRSLLRSEARHFQDYLKLAMHYAGHDIAERVAEFRQLEARLVVEPDTDFRFHSGPPDD